VTDDLGRHIDLPQHVSRAISLAPSITESIFAAGAGDRLVGVTTFCNYPAETASIEKVGDTLNPNIEKIIALKPDIVFVSTASQLEAFTHTLAEQKIAVYVSNASGLEGVVQGIRKLGEIFETNGPANKTADDIERRTVAIGDYLNGEKPARVFIQISNEPLFTVGKNAFLTEAIQFAGGESVTKDVESAYPKLSKETALALNPDVIILSDSEDNQEPNAVFKNSPAVKNGRVFKINADIISRPGPRLVDAIEQIAGFLHGERN
jgi:iron complex transport system substrate-binding protein